MGGVVSSLLLKLAPGGCTASLFSQDCDSRLSLRLYDKLVSQNRFCILIVYQGRW